jgi:Na+/H+ antiporter NhaD/arsenite permease-like protein
MRASEPDEGKAGSEHAPTRRGEAARHENDSRAVSGRIFLVRIRGWLIKEPILTILVTAFILLQLLHPQRWRDVPALIDWQTVMTLAGLLMLTKAVEYSGFLMWIAHRLVRRINTERGLALLLVLLAAALSTLLTNDVALFAIVPLMLSLHELVPLPVGRLVILIALAVNAGSILTPLGNPQNLFLWQTGGASFGAFVVALAPLCAALMAALLVLTVLMCGPVKLDLSRDRAPHPVDRRLFGVALVAFAAFVALADLHHAGVALAVVALGFGVWRREVVLSIDWVLLLIFALMFIVLRSVAALPIVHDALARIALTQPVHAYAAGALISQAISNVPAAIMLAEFTRDWRALAFGVSVGGFGIAIGSLANLIAMRLVGSHGNWWRFHVVSLPFYALAGLLGWLLL